MRLQALHVSVDGPAALPADRVFPGDAAGSICRFCSLRPGLHAMGTGRETTCVLCGLVQSLHRLTIDEEVRLIWLPEMSQAVLNVLVRQIHIELRDLGESVHCEDVPSRPEGMLPVLYMAQRILLKRCDVISERLGSSRAGDLAEALTALARRHAKIEALPLGGLRIFPAGRFYIDGVNVYDKIVDSWRGRPEAAKSSDLRAVLAEVAPAEFMAEVA